jgi:cytochrome c553
MKTVLLMAVAILSQSALADPFVLGGDASKGEAKFKQLCISCHGEKGNGQGAAAAAMNPKPGNFTDPANSERLTDEWIYKMVKNGGAANGKSPMMVAWGGVLKDNEVRDVAAYVTKFKPAPVSKVEAKVEVKKEAPKAGKKKTK